LYFLLISSPFPLGRKILFPILPLPKGKGEEKGGGWEYKISPSLILPLQRRGERGGEI